MDSNQIEEKILVALEEIRPFLASDGGDISLVSIENDKKGKGTTPRSLCFLHSQSDDLKDWG